MGGYQYVFVGHVLPVAADVTIFMEFNIQTGTTDETLEGTMDISHSEITIKLQHVIPLDDLVGAKDRLQRMALIYVAPYGFSYGLGLDVEIVKEIGVSTPQYIFGTSNEEIAFENKEEVVRRYWDLIDQSQARNWRLRIALINYMRAIRDPEETMMFCYRAIEAVRNDPTFVAPKGTPKDKIEDEIWENVREVLCLGAFENYLQPLTKRAKGHRHGEQVIPSHKEYIAALITARTVIQRYAEYLSHGRTPLSPKDFPVPTQSEFYWLSSVNHSTNNSTSFVSTTSFGSTAVIDVRLKNPVD